MILTLLRTRRFERIANLFLPSVIRPWLSVLTSGVEVDWKRTEMELAFYLRKAMKIGELANKKTQKKD